MPHETVLTTTLVAEAHRMSSWMLFAGMIGLLVIGSRFLWRARWALTGTTLLAAWWWALLSWLSLVVALLAGALGPWPLPDRQVVVDGWRELLAMAAATTTVCPGVAVLGAKRPQHVAWQWIVLSLWAVLMLPAVGWQLLGTDATVHPARQWFLLAVLSLGVVNYLPTRYGRAAVFLGLAQWSLLGKFLPFSLPEGFATPLFSFATLVCALIEVRYRAKLPAQADPLERLWRDFRDSYGLLWGLRVAERFNTQAKASSRAVSLTWNGFQTPRGAGLAGLSAEERQAVVDNLTSWLRRFVDGAWIARRLNFESVGAEKS